jgi:hypothetical protein
MSFRTLKADVIRRNLLSTDYFAESVTLTDGEGATTTTVANPSPEVMEERPSTEYGTEFVTTREFFLELTGAVPRTVTLDDEDVTYAVEHVTKQGEFTILKTKRIGAGEISRDSYRKRKP